MFDGCLTHQTKKIRLTNDWMSREKRCKMATGGNAVVHIIMGEYKRVINYTKNKADEKSACLLTLTKFKK